MGVCTRQGFSPLSQSDSPRLRASFEGYARHSTGSLPIFSLYFAMSQHRKALWEADPDEDLQDVDLNLAIGNYGQSGLYDDGMFLNTALSSISD